MRIPSYTGPIVQSILDTMQARNFVVFLIIFVLIILTFSVGFSLAFGANLFAYRSIPESFITLVQMVFGSFDYPSLATQNRILGPFLFVIFNGFTGFVLMNMLIAILSEIYIDIQSKQEELGKSGLTEVEYQEWMTYFSQRSKTTWAEKFASYRLLNWGRMTSEHAETEMTKLEAALKPPSNDDRVLLDLEENSFIDKDPAFVAEVVSERFNFYQRDLDELTAHLRESRLERANKSKLTDNLQDLDGRLRILNNQMTEGFSHSRLEMENIHLRLNQLMNMTASVQSVAESSMESEKRELYAEIKKQAQAGSTYVI